MISHANGVCDDDTIFFQGVLDDIHLVADESMELLLEINNGVYEYCRILDLQSGDMSFEEVSCTKNVREWEPIPSYDIEVLPTDDATVTVTFGNESASLMLTGDGGVYIDPTLFAYFYSISMKTLFIFTAPSAPNDTVWTILDSDAVNLVSISWDTLDGDYPDDLAAFSWSMQEDVVADSSSFPTPFLNGQLWPSYDGDDMFMLEVAPSTEGCNGGNPWVRYSFLDDLYQNGSQSMQFEFVGYGFVGVDTRIQRAFGFNRHSNAVWYYEADGDELNEWRSESFEFGDAELTSYWVVMFVAIAVFVLYCCCCCCCVYHSKSRSRGSHSRNTSNSTEMYTTTSV